MWWTRGSSSQRKTFVDWSAGPTNEDEFVIDDSGHPRHMCGGCWHWSSRRPPSPTLTLLYPLSLISLADTPIPCLTYISSTIYNQDGSFLNGCRPMQHFLPWWDDWCFGNGPPSIGGQKIQYKVHLYSGFHIHSGRRVGHRVSSRSLFFFFFFWGRPIIMKTSRNVSHYKF